MIALELNNVAKVLERDVFGKRPSLLEEVTFAVSQGSCHGLVGANGAGKSTTLRLALGVMTPSAGRVLLKGGSPRLPSSRRGVGYAPDIVALDGALTAAETLALHWVLIGRTGRPPAAVLDEVELSGRSHEPISRFSKGMGQRLSLAIALLGDPDFIILDEPMSGLDPSGRALVKRIIRDRSQAGTTILFSSHVLSDIEDLCSDVTVIDKGRTRFSGPLARLIGPSQGHTITTGSATGTRRTIQASDDRALLMHIQSAIDQGDTVVSVETTRPSLEEAVVTLLGNQP